MPRAPAVGCLTAERGARPGVAASASLQSQQRSVVALILTRTVIVPTGIAAALAIVLVLIARYTVGLSLWWLVIALVAVAVLAVVTLLLARHASRQIASDIAALQTGLLSEPPIAAGESSLLELVELGRAQNSLLDRLARHEADLVSARRDLELKIREVDLSNHELGLAHQQLNVAQQKLINAEKMASLGSLVAGVTHEINTPLGVGLTAASTLKTSTNQAQEAYRRGDMTHAALEQYLNGAAQGSDILVTNLNRAAELIRSFKQVAVDQSNDEIRRFGLRAHIGELLVSLRPQFVSQQIDVRFDCDGRIQAHSYPGVVSQVVTNLITNSLAHAFAEGEGGTLDLQIKEEEGTIVLVCRDNGCGIPPQHIERIFEPFFTTRRGQGGTGLGMHIVYNLVTQQLCGSVDIDSEVGQGTTIVVTFPADISKVSRYGAGD